MRRYLELPHIREPDFNKSAVLPYGLTIDEIKIALTNIHSFLFKINNYLVSEGYPRLEELLLLNAFAGLISEVIVKNLADASSTLTRNTKVGGYPDLIPKERYPDDSVLRGEGIEIKASKQKGGWQGHNPEEGWIMVFRYKIDNKTLPIENREATEIIEVYAAELQKQDWSFSGRSRTSRRTITASIIQSGMEKLRSNWIYRRGSAKQKS